MLERLIESLGANLIMMSRCLLFVIEPFSREVEIDQEEENEI